MPRSSIGLNTTTSHASWCMLMAHAFVTARYINNGGRGRFASTATATANVKGHSSSSTRTPPLSSNIVYHTPKSTLAEQGHRNEQRPSTTTLWCTFLAIGKHRWQTVPCAHLPSSQAAVSESNKFLVYSYLRHGSDLTHFPTGEFRGRT